MVKPQKRGSQAPGHHSDPHVEERKSEKPAVLAWKSVTHSFQAQQTNTLRSVAQGDSPRMGSGWQEEGRAGRRLLPEGKQVPVPGCPPAASGHSERPGAPCYQAG